MQNSYKITINKKVVDDKTYSTKSEAHEALVEKMFAKRDKVVNEKKDSYMFSSLPGVNVWLSVRKASGREFTVIGEIVEQE